MYFRVILDTFVFSNPSWFLKTLELNEISWIGLERSEPGGDFSWRSDGAPLDQSLAPWAPGQPADEVKCIIDVLFLRPLSISVLFYRATACLWTPPQAPGQALPAREQGT